MLKSFSNQFARIFSTDSSPNIIPKATEELKTNIQVNKLTDHPDEAWNLIENKIKKKEIEPIKLDTPIFENKIRFVCISDTHSKTDRMYHEIPAGDVFIHAGDFTNVGSIKDVTNFSKFLKTLDDKFSYKIVIAGNHELTFDQDCNKGVFQRFKTFSNDENESKDPREFLNNCIYLEDSFVEIYGIKIYGSPWQPRFGDWAFNVDRGEEILKKWNRIPYDTNVLITHGPPLGFGDIVRGGYHVGCCELLSTIRERVKPKFHIFGHIHEDYGSWSDDVTTYINASMCDLRYNPVNPPIIFDIGLPENVTKDSFLKENDKDSY